MLTAKQRELLLFINQRLTATGVSPSFDEMKDALRLKSKSGIHRLVSGLEERGFIRRLPHRARALEVIKLPEESAAGGGRRPRRFSPTVIRGDFKASLPGRSGRPRCRGGRSAALRPNCRRHPDRGVARPECDGRRAGEPARPRRRALCAGGCRRQHDRGRHPRWRHRHHRARRYRRKRRRCRGPVDNEEVTLKRLRRRGASIALEPANKAYETRIFGPDRVKVQGRLVGLLRRY